MLRGLWTVTVGPLALNALSQAVSRFSAPTRSPENCEEWRAGAAGSRTESATGVPGACVHWDHARRKAEPARMLNGAAERYL